MATSQTAGSAADSAGTMATGFGLSYAIASIFNALLMVLKEASPAVHDGLGAITGNHWVTHGLLNLIVFVVLGLVLSRSSYAHMSASSLINTIVGSTVVSGLIIAGFFLIVG
jgi:uncharacterized membrane protein